MDQIQSSYEQLSPEIQNFLAIKKPAITDIHPAEQQVVIDSGETVFSSIQSAIDSITDAGEENQYIIYIGPGTYHEKIILKPWVFLEGAGQEATTIVYPGDPDGSALHALITAANNSGISRMRVQPFKVDGAVTYACLDCTGANNFVCNEVQLIAEDDTSYPCNFLPVTNNFGIMNGPACNVVIIGCTITATAKHPHGFAIGIWAASNGRYQVIDSTVTAWGVYAAIAGAANPGAGTTMLFHGCTISGSQCALEAVPGSSITTMNSSVEGRIGSGVTVYL